MDIDDRPTKRVRLSPDGWSNHEASEIYNGATEALDEVEKADNQNTSQPLTNGQATGHDFNVDKFCAVVGEQVDVSVLKAIQDASNGDLQRAVNMYFDGSWQTSVAERAQRSAISSWTKKEPAKNKEPVKSVKHFKTCPEQRYIGSFGVEGWATKSGTKLIMPGEAVRIERSKQTSKAKLGRGGKPVAFSFRNQKADVITRFTNSRGEEVGRLPEEVARWVAPLLDQKICKLQGVCVFAEEKLRINDTIYIQIKAFMLKTAFDSSAFIKPEDDNRETGFFAEKESTEEKDLRLRQVALVKLFEEINLNPKNSNSTVAKHKKQGLLRAAEMAENYEKEKKDKSKAVNTPTTQSDEDEDGEELEEDQLDMLYQKAQQFDFNMPVAEPDPTFALNLRKYQRQALHWMLSKERGEESDRASSMHPLWEEYAWPVKDADDEPLLEIEDQKSFYVNLYSGEISLEFPVQEQNCLGGILADEMGLGKTIEMFSLIHSNTSPEFKAAAGKTISSVNHLPRLPQTSNTIEPAPCTTLVVAPMSLLAQWESEAVKASVPGSLRTLVYYGSEKGANLQTLCSAANAASAPNVIITSYGVVLSEFNQIAGSNADPASHGGLFSVEFFRVILDEAHTIKNRQAKTSKACYELQAKHRWVLTGTPIVNRLEDLFSLVRFLKVEPWNNFSYWKTFITVPFESKDVIRALNVVQTVLEPLVMRRTKDMKTPEGEALVPLPTKSLMIEEVELSKTEREVYDLVFNRAKRTFNEAAAAGNLMKSYTTIFAQILRLRQSCCHPILTRNKDIVADEEEAAAAKAAMADNGLADDIDLQDLIDRFTADAEDAAKTPVDKNPITKFTAHALKQIQTDSSGECALCLAEPMENPVVTTCWHSACNKCLQDNIDQQLNKQQTALCFMCRKEIDPRDVFEIVKYGTSNGTTSTDDFDETMTESDDLYGTSAPKPRISLRRLHPYSPSAATSAKIGALLRHLTSQTSNTKSVVFSQFTSFLDLIGPQLKRHDITFLRFDGTMSQKIRAQTLKQFTSESADSPRVLLLSLRAGGVGLNLTAANKCYMMDPWWAFAVEAQAIDRVHRMGQTQKVEVIRFIVKDSIEGRMLKIQEKKMAVAGSLGIGHGSSGGGSIEDLQMLLG